MGQFFSYPSRPRNKQQPETRANLTIRNLTITPLELKLIERFDGHPVPAPGGGGLAGIASNITSFISGNDTYSASPGGGYGISIREGAAPRDRQDVDGVSLGAFETKGTDILAADPGKEVLRLTFAEPGTPHRYTVDVPGPSPRSLTLDKVGGGGDSPHEFTAVYLPAGSFLAIYSSADLNAWMRALRDDCPLSMLSIPGTHNSPTCHTALPSVRCQAVGVREQLDNGVRFMDIRVSASPDGDDLALVHSAFPISLTGTKYLADLLDDVYAFLDANPSEALVMSLKREGTGRGTDQHMSRYLRGRYLGGDAARRWFTEPRIPSLGEARGKIVLVRRFGIDDSLRGEHGGRGWGIDASSWPDNCADGTVGSGLIRVQDFYEVDQSTNIQKKIDLARAQLERACQQLFVLPGTAAAAAAVQDRQQQQQQQAGPAPLPFFVNFLSASNFFNASCWPEKIAGKVNPSVIEYLCVRHADPGKGPNQLSVGDAGTGIVVTDWVGHNGDWDLIRCIVGWNARLQMKQ